ncbi:MAG TPA: CPBP family intramembrane glutamic endopeptidase [Anaeromyxobacter sp.]|nr:CPBP family intramembrane glutamic endopeptidase [Anaeromyxobacter sp.]
MSPGRFAAAKRWAAIAFGVAFPTALTLVYFVALAGEPRGLVQGVYAAGKSIQFAVPAIWAASVLGRLPRPSWPSARGAVAGLAFGLAVLAGALALFYAVLEPSGLLAGGPAAAIRGKVHAFGVTTLARYVTLAAFYSVVHAAAEEYYWRWFVFGELRRACGAVQAVAWSSVAFAAHHVVILGVYFGWGSPWTAVLALAVGVGGAYWAALYHRSGSLLGPWLGHLLVDAAIFFMGYELAFGAP